jgi:alpha-beta hydrolase superfamily lysophospholipase
MRLVDQRPRQPSRIRALPWSLVAKIPPFGCPRRWLAAVAVALLAGCTGPQPGTVLAPPPTLPSLTLNAVYTADGADLPLRSFLPEGPPRAVIVALHGFNDYSNAFFEPALYLKRRGIALLAYDQRGFGAAPERGRWAGERRLTDDLREVVGLVRQRYPGVPLYVLGESMGAAVAMVAMTEPAPPPVDGLILVAPAVRGRGTLSGLQRVVLDVMSSAAPWFEVSPQGLRILPSDNFTMLSLLSRDPLVIRHTRTDAVRGLVDLMDHATEAAARLTVPTLILTGERDEVITPVPTCLMLSRLPQRPPGAWRFMLYPNGYHMLLRDRDGPLVLTDVMRWIEDKTAALPSGDERLVAAAEPAPADIVGLPTCSTVADRLREDREFTAAKPER